MCPQMPTCACMYFYTWMHFCTLTCLLSMWSIPKHTMTCGIKENKSKNAQKKKGKETKDIKREQSIRSFKTEKDGRDGKVLTCMTRRRKRIVNRSPGSQEKKQKDIKKGTTNAAHSNHSKLKKDDKDGKMLTRIAYRRRRILNRSPRLQDMSKRRGWGEVGSKRQKRREKAENEEERSCGAS